MDWPILYKQVLHVKNPASSVGIAVMWTERQVVADLLKDQEYCVIGSLYSSAGISAMIRNIFANPGIRTIIVWGADLSRSGQALLSFMENGVDSDFFIIGDDRGGQIEPEIGQDAIRLFRERVTIINLRGKPPGELRETVDRLGKIPSLPFTEPTVFPTSRPKPFTYPSEQTGFRAHGNTVAQTWLKILQTVLRYGRNKKTRYTQENELKEVLNMMAVVYGENADQPYLPHFFPFSRKDLDVYYPQVLSAKRIPGIAYTYGQRLRDHDGVDQIQNIITLIKERPFSKKMLAVTSQVKHDWGEVNKGDTPCLTQVLGAVQDGKLCLTVHFRSQDMVHGWPRNMFSLLKLQKLMAAESGVGVGTFTSITHSAHIYSDDYTLVEKILADHYTRELGYTARQYFEEDSRGNMVISVEMKQEQYEIVAKLYAPDGGLLLHEWRGNTAMEVYIQMINIGEYLVLPSHLIYIGTELQRAEYAIKSGKPQAYSQDPAAHKAL